MIYLLNLVFQSGLDLNVEMLPLPIGKQAIR